MAAALEEASRQDWGPVRSLINRLEGLVQEVGGESVNAGLDRLPNTLSVILPGIAAQTQLMMLDLDGFCVSAGSACSSGKVSVSHVLRAMGLGEKAGQAIRISLPWNVKANQVDAFAKAYQEMAKRLLKR